VFQEILVKSRFAVLTSQPRHAN